MAYLFGIVFISTLFFSHICVGELYCSTEKANWTEAVRICQDHNAQLVSVDVENNKTQLHDAELLSGHLTLQAGDSMWTGNFLSPEALENSDLLKLDITEDYVCGAVLLSEVPGETNTYNETRLVYKDCSEELPYLCENDADKISVFHKNRNWTEVTRLCKTRFLSFKYGSTFNLQPDLRITQHQLYWMKEVARLQWNTAKVMVEEDVKPAAYLCGNLAWGEDYLSKSDCGDMNHFVCNTSDVKQQTAGLRPCQAEGSRAQQVTATAAVRTASDTASSGELPESQTPLETDQPAPSSQAATSDAKQTTSSNLADVTTGAQQTASSSLADVTEIAILPVDTSASASNELSLEREEDPVQYIVIGVATVVVEGLAVAAIICLYRRWASSDRNSEECWVCVSKTKQTSAPRRDDPNSETLHNERPSMELNEGRQSFDAASNTNAQCPSADPSRAAATNNRDQCPKAGPSRDAAIVNRDQYPKAGSSRAAAYSMAVEPLVRGPCRAAATNNRDKCPKAGPSRDAATMNRDQCHTAGPRGAAAYSMAVEPLVRKVVEYELVKLNDDVSQEAHPGDDCTYDHVGQVRKSKDDGEIDVPVNIYDTFKHDENNDYGTLMTKKPRKAVAHAYDHVTIETDSVKVQA